MFQPAPTGVSSACQKYSRNAAAFPLGASACHTSRSKAKEGELARAL